MERNQITLKMANVVESDPTKIADEFNRYFTNIAPKIWQDIPRSRKSFRDYMGRPNQNSLIKRLDPHKSTGPFSIPNKILHLCINEISTILSDIFNLSLTTGRFLTKLKTAKVIPLYKNKGSEQEISNFRVLLYNLDKIFRETSTQKVYTI